MTGSERYYFDLLRALSALGVASTGLVVGAVLTQYDASSHGESVAPEAGTTARARITSLRRAVRRIAPSVELVASHAPEHTWIALDLIRNKPVVVHFHGPRVLEYIAEGRGFARVTLARIAETLTFARASRFIVLSEANALVLERHYRVARKRIRIVPGGVDLHRFFPTGSRSEARLAMGWPLERPIVIAARRLAETKGLENLIDATLIIKKRIPNIYVALAGAGPLRDALKARVAALGLEENVHFVGQLGESLPSAYRAADVSIVPSEELEGFGLSVIESLACGTAALVTPVTGLPEVVRGLDERLILAGSTPGDIADGISAALSPESALPQEDACVAYAQRFAWPSIAARIKAVYEEALSEKRHAR